MPCLRFREAISARLDGEDLGMPASELDGHLDGCAECAGWAAQAGRVTRRARLGAAPDVPDLTATVLAALPRELPGVAAAARSRLVDTGLRLALLVVGAAQAGLARPPPTSGHAPMSAPMHMTHQTRAWKPRVAPPLPALAPP